MSSRIPILLLVAGLTLQVGGRLLAASQPKPNVVMIVSDDQGWLDFGFMGHSVIRKPQLDKFAAERAVFPNGYVPTSLWRAGLESKCELCVQALDLFVNYYGVEASNLALKSMSIGGLYVGVGIAPKIINKLKDGDFMKAFCATGRMTDLMKAMPVRVILNDKTALIGAARLAAAQAGWIR